MSVVPTPIISNVATNTGFRPKRSPMMPNRMPPKGRTTNPTPKVRNANNVPTTGSLFGKNSSPNTNAAAVPYRKKSYHSSADPILAARITRKRERSSVVAVISVMISPVMFFCGWSLGRRLQRVNAPGGWHGRVLAGSGGAGEVRLLRGGLSFVDRPLPLRRRQRQAHGNVGHAWRHHRITRQQPAVELVKILHAHQRPGVAGGDLVKQQIARAVRSVHRRTV